METFKCSKCENKIDDEELALLEQTQTFEKTSLGKYKFVGGNGDHIACPECGTIISLDYDLEKL